MNNLIERLQYIADSPDRLLSRFHVEAVQTAKDAIAEITALKTFVASLRSLAFEEFYGRYADVGDDIRTLKFVIFDSDGNGVASGDNALTAIENFSNAKRRTNE